MPVLSELNPVPFGKLVPASQALPPLLSRIGERIAHLAGHDSDPGRLANFLGRALGEAREGNVLQLPAQSRLRGDLVVDKDCAWVNENAILGVACEGDLEIKGDLLNFDQGPAPFVLIAGRLDVGSVVHGSATMIVLGDLEASGVFVAENREGITHVGGELASEALYVHDHDIYVRGDTFGPVFDDTHPDLSQAFVREIYGAAGDVRPLVGRLWAWQRAGLPILR